ncbi:hypothetical protein K458DRAFT_392380 [Lentithecium fluviatile CBS 122367]|uniref:Uncharacterized protein n=1 Tax=Lentithecium fluviatile CBS 122367 TaxID=1168545 RepID=A0A6G1ISC9_9PLEO|nr:hypothetical protein K458DRAFT_392380 [Lentithecium fluviatile CBS 122367]
MKAVLATTVALFAVAAHGSVVFMISTEKNGQGIQGGGVTDRWVCHDLAEPLVKNASWAFVASGLANGCFLYEDLECKGENVWIEKNNSNVLGPGPVNLTDVGFDDRASSWACY